ncbi:MAG TPA: RNA methyltransferase [Niabella sp.]|nr:RNA methyltransferase [Niabella sp.]HOZ96225.1 RNA methyltransferase [Niabella sp.]HQW13590.1 RNA methyltransferase [Niabella sp.]HQX18984.1 RNA methyltransferase [Niabella sp.]HQX40489.1 RNA methyltransferase [Niabella sp.]
MLSKSEVKYIQTLSQKKQRVSEGLFIIEGPKLVIEAIGNKIAKINKVYALASWVLENEIALAEIETTIITNWELEKISQLISPNQVLALVHTPDSQEFVPEEKGISLALDGIQDPGNLGTIIRIADWFGIKQIICSKDCADAYNFKVVQATMGSIFRIKIFYTDLEACLRQHSDLAVYGAVLDGKSIGQFAPPERGIIIIGNESKGIRENILPYVTEKITIEKRGAAESLNAAVATGIILSQLT